MAKSSTSGRDDLVDPALDRLGYSVVRLLDAERADIVRCEITALGPASDDPQVGVFVGTHSADELWRAAVVVAAAPYVEQISAALVGFRAVDVALETAWPGPSSYTVPQRGGRFGLTVRVPLDGTGSRQRDGVVPGSHRLLGTGPVPPEVATEVRQRLSHRPAVDAGEALLLDDRVMLWTPSNKTDRQRRTLVIRLGRSGVDRDGRGEDLPDEGDAGRIDPIAVVDVEAIVRQCGEALLAPARILSVKTSQRRRRATAPGVLVDDAADRRLGRDGFVSIREFVPPELARALRRTYGDLHGWSGEDFVVDFWSEDTAYRRRADAAIESAVDAYVNRWFPGHRPLSRSFLVKWPGGDEERFPQVPHLDWMYTDEPHGVRSWTIWIALDDVTERNGALRVARGSHRIPAGVQGTGLKTSWLEHRKTWDRRLLGVPTRCGDAIISDAGLVHSSFPNDTAEPRVAVAIAVCPVDATLVHYRRVDASTVARYEVGDDFYLEQPLDELVHLGPDLAPTWRIRVDHTTRSPRRLSWDLDRQPLAVVDHLARARHELVDRFRTREASARRDVRAVGDG